VILPFLPQPIQYNLGRQIEMDQCFSVNSTDLAMSLIPMRCFTCGERLASKYMTYVGEVQREKGEAGCEAQKPLEYLTNTKDLTPSVEAKTMDKLQLYKWCCRRHMLTHVDIY
jgi:DNA-directed RNA polymerase subunit N (RpoN/RPB10)